MSAAAYKRFHVRILNHSPNITEFYHSPDAVDLPRELYELADSPIMHLCYVNSSISFAKLQNINANNFEQKCHITVIQSKATTNIAFP